MVGRAFGWVAPVLVFAVLACGGAAGGGAGGGPSEYDAGARDAPRSGPDSSPPPVLLTDGGGKDGGLDAACATTSAKASTAPAYLVFVMDRSNSMGADSKWTSCSSALESFFSSPATSLSASLTLFPSPSVAKKDECAVSDYETPSVPMTALPSTTFASVIGATTLEGGTPTLPALTGAVEYATTVQSAHPGAKVDIVLATDGIPAGCTGNTVTTVAAEATTALMSSGISTYVIGVGKETTNLDAIAAAGGTKSAFIVSTSDPATTTKEFEAAIATIQAELGCTFSIPSPGGGQKLDPSKVNVVLTSGGAKTTIDYSQDCSDSDGWYYDDPTKPSEVILCSGACTKAESSGSNAIDIVFGCETVGAPK
jgi:hypothetical protein